MSVQQEEDTIDDRVSEINVSLVFQPNDRSYDSNTGSMADLGRKFYKVK